MFELDYLHVREPIRLTVQNILLTNFNLTLNLFLNDISDSTP